MMLIAEIFLLISSTAALALVWAVFSPSRLAKYEPDVSTAQNRTRG